MGLARDGFPSHLTFFELFVLKVAFDDVAKNYKYTLTVKGHHVATRTFLIRSLLENFFKNVYSVYIRTLSNYFTYLQRRIFKTKKTKTKDP